MAVYFIHDAATQLIKIGHATDPRARLRQIQVHCPGKVTLLAAEDGGAMREAQLHALFCSERVRGEWFRASELLLNHIATLPATPPRKRINAADWGNSGHTDETVAEATGISRSQLSRIRRGLTDPSWSAARKIAQVIGWSLDDLASLREAA